MPASSIMALAACFLMGVANFTMHKAVFESGHPFVEDTKLYFGRYLGKTGSYIFEFIVLLGALLFTSWGSLLIFWIYLVYTLMNLLAAWLLLSGRI